MEKGVLWGKLCNFFRGYSAKNKNISVLLKAKCNNIICQKKFGQFRFQKKKNNCLKIKPSEIF